MWRHHRRESCGASRTESCGTCAEGGTCSSSSKCEFVAEPCDPVVYGGESTCPEGQACCVDPATGAVQFYCAPVGTMPVGEACSAMGVCVPGAECLDGYCREFCPLYLDVVACGENETCQAVDGFGVFGACFPLP